MDIHASWLQNHLADGIPVLVGWSHWGGYWQVVVGYDTMNTDYQGDDVIVMADSFDITDHNQDGYGVYGMERFFANFTFFDFFPDDHPKDSCFIAAKPVSDAN